MEIWHVTVFGNNQAFDEDRVGLEPAKQWALQKVHELGYNGEITWHLEGDACTATISPQLAVRIQRRT